MHIDRVHLIGAGGHGCVVADALAASGLTRDRLVPRDGVPGRSIQGVAVVTPETGPDLADEAFHVAIGSAIIRARLYALAIAEGGVPLTVIHPAAVVASDAVIGPAGFVAAGAIVSARARTGLAAIVNHAAVVDHDVVIGDFSHIAPNATLGGGVTVGNSVLIGSGAVVLPGVRIADDVVVGAGAVIVSDIGAPGTWVGNPARRLDD